MKKWILVVGMIACAGISCAQEQDVVKEGDPWYLFREHGDLNGERNWWERYGWSVSQALYQFSDKVHDDVTVYGVAVTTRYLPIHDDRGYTASSMSPTMLLYQHVANGNPPQWTFLDSANVDGLVKRSQFMYSTLQEDYVVPCYEFYFDTPRHFHMPTDTFFYVGYYITSERVQRYNEYWRSELNSDVDSFWSVYLAHYANPTEPYAWGWTLSGPNAGMVVPDIEPIKWGGIFPIVGLRCTPTRLKTIRRGDGSAEVNWRRKDYPEFYQVSLAPADSQPEAGVMVSTVDTTWTFDSLQPGRDYSVWVRKACRYTTAGYDTLVYSEWSEPMRFSALGVGEVDGEGLQIGVQEGCVTVRGMTWGEQAEVVDMKGVRVVVLRGDGRTRPLAPGIYLIRTTSGSARKVVVM